MISEAEREHAQRMRLDGARGIARPLWTYCEGRYRHEFTSEIEIASIQSALGLALMMYQEIREGFRPGCEHHAWTPTHCINCGEDNPDAAREFDADEAWEDGIGR